MAGSELEVPATAAQALESEAIVTMLVVQATTVGLEAVAAEEVTASGTAEGGQKVVVVAGEQRLREQQPAQAPERSRGRRSHSSRR